MKSILIFFISLIVIPNTIAENLELKVPEMVCMSCASKIRKVLRDELKLKNIKFDIENKIVRMPCPNESCSFEKVAVTLSDIGYNVEKINP